MIHSAWTWLLAGAPPHALQVLALAAFAALEYYLPRSRFRANSTIEAVANTLEPLLARVPLVAWVIARLATPKDGAALELPPPPRSGSQAGWVTFSELVSLVALGLAFAAVCLAAGCGHTFVDSATIAVESAENVESAATDSLLKYDQAHQDAIVAQAKTKAAGAAALAAYRQKREQLEQTLVKTAAVISTARALLPLVSDGLKPPSDLQQILGDLVQAGLELKSALQTFGLTLPGGL